MVNLATCTFNEDKQRMYWVDKEKDSLNAIVLIHHKPMK